MQMKRVLCMFLCCTLLIGVILLPANAAEIQAVTMELPLDDLVTPRATGSFNWTIPAKTKVKGDTVFPLAAGETVTIKASYSPFSASVDFGIIAPDGNFYGFNITSGSIDKTIRVNESGDYILQIRNNSSTEIEVSGFVNY